jgi:hypothetical protein
MDHTSNHATGVKTGISRVLKLACLPAVLLLANCNAPPQPAAEPAPAPAAAPAPPTTVIERERVIERPAVTVVVPLGAAGRDDDRRREDDDRRRRDDEQKARDEHRDDRPH